MIQHTYDVQTFDDGNKIIRPALSNEYEALLGCLIDFPDLMERSVDIVIDGEAEIYNTAGNVFSADIEKEITVITCYLVDDYERRPASVLNIIKSFVCFLYYFTAGIFRIVLKFRHLRSAMELDFSLCYNHKK